MARYIDAEALLKKIIPYDVVDKKCYTINAKAVYEQIQNAPTVEVIVVPCKIGDPIYRVCSPKGVRQQPSVRKFKLTWNNLRKTLEDFGTLVFLTEKEAEIAMTKGDNNVYQQKEI